jgi:hypothetical protein
MSGIRAAGAYAVASAVLAVALGVGVLLGPYRAIERSDYMTYHVAARMVLAGNGDCLYDPACQAEAQHQLIGEEPTFEGGALPFNSPPWLAALVAPLGALPLTAAFTIFTVLGLAVLALAAWLLAQPLGAARPLAPILLLTAWPTVMGAVRGQSTLLVAGLLGLSVAWSRYASGAALGLAALKPTLPPVWAAWVLLGRHWRAVASAAAVLMALVGIGLMVVGPVALAEYPGHLVGVAGADATGVHPEEMINWRGVGTRLAAGEWLAWAGVVLTLAVVAFVWLRTPDRDLGAAAAFFATPLVVPHANQHEFILGSVGVLLVLRATAGRRLPVWGAAIGLHALLWTGPLLDAEISAWLLFATLLAWLGATAWVSTRSSGHQPG